VTEIKPDNKADAGYWNSFYQAMGFRVADPADPVRQFLETFIPGDAEGSCLEVGCFPGRFLAVGGELGYELSGIDFADRFPDMQAWLQKSGYRCGQFLNQDFFTLSPEPKFDVVMSFGFIEHFENYEAAIERHRKPQAPPPSCHVPEAMGQPSQEVRNDRAVPGLFRRIPVLGRRG
jgi:SAM-dependent methyltransferase